MAAAAGLRKHFAWLGVAVAVAGLVSYFTLAVKVPALRDVPVLNIGLVLAGVSLSAVALVRRRSWWSALGLAVSVLAAAALLGYVFVLSEQLPGAERAVAVGSPAPAFELADQDGAPVRLADFSGRPLVVVFYRGFW